MLRVSVLLRVCFAACICFAACVCSFLEHPFACANGSAATLRFMLPLLPYGLCCRRYLTVCVAAATSHLCLPRQHLPRANGTNLKKK
ncbi:hypothetical protein [Methanimicrococcus blatticola]|uniref:hypothetical protein n=1 Tax=Methanimicrococcus blatticola TaxID=91560 RepID=UPI00105D9750|nr:hypothetical protein [Methanimicrococcus blatticola]MBZ3935502.1 hypothetical protein [Methanimicrococcus blatticola]